MAKVLRGARSGSSTRLPISAVFRRVAQEGVAQGSSPAAPAAGMGRLMHTGAKLPFGRQSFSSQQHKIVRKEQIVYMLCAMSLGMVLPNSTIWRHFKRE